MKPKTFMLNAGDPSGDILAAELVIALRAKVVEASFTPTDDVQPLLTELAPHFFGAGGPRMAAAGVELTLDMAQHSVIGLTSALKGIFKFHRIFRQLFRVALDRQPDVIIGVDFGYFNLRFARAIKRYVRRHSGIFQDWKPKIIQYVSPQVWASRPGRADKLAANCDLLLSIFPFEKDWYARRAPTLRVEFVGHPMAERFGLPEIASAKSENGSVTRVVLLPGSRPAELSRHLPALFLAMNLMRTQLPNLRVRMVLPNEALAQQAREHGLPVHVEVQTGGLAEALAQADLAIASTGTVTMECALFGVPAVTLYKVSWLEYQIGKRVVTVKWLTMPNLLANEEVFPEFVQYEATPENISRAAVELLRDATRRQAVKAKLAKIVASLGGPGATTRAAEAIVELLK